MTAKIWKDKIEMKTSKLISYYRNKINTNCQIIRYDAV